MVFNAHKNENQTLLVPTSIEQIREYEQMLLRIPPQQRLHYVMCAFNSYLEWIINSVLHTKKQEKQKTPTNEKISSWSLFTRMSYELKKHPVGNALLKQQCASMTSMCAFKARSKILVSLIDQQPPYLKNKLKRAQQLQGAVNKKKRKIAKQVGAVPSTSTRETKANTVEAFIEAMPHIKHSIRHIIPDVQLRIDMKHIAFPFESFVQPHKHQPARAIEDGLFMFM
jgi:hypothetical protein